MKNDTNKQNQNIPSMVVPYKSLYKSVNIFSTQIVIIVTFSALKVMVNIHYIKMVVKKILIK